MARLAEVMWKEQKEFRYGRRQRELPPIERPAMGAIVQLEGGERTLLSRRLEASLVRSLRKVSGSPVYPRPILTEWEEELKIKGGVMGSFFEEQPVVLLEDPSQARWTFSLFTKTDPEKEILVKKEPPPEFVNVSARNLSLTAAEFGFSDALVTGTYQVTGDLLTVYAELTRLTPYLRVPILTVARARVSIPLGALSLAEIIGRIPPRENGTLPRPPADWVRNPVSVWYEVIRGRGARRKGLDGSIVRTADSFLVSFMTVRPLYLMVLRLNSDGGLRILFPERGGDLSGRAVPGERYSVPTRLAERSHWAALYVLFSEEPFRYRRDVLPGVRHLVAQIQSGASMSATRSGLILPTGVYQRRLWLTETRTSPGLRRALPQGEPGAGTTPPRP